MTFRSGEIIRYMAVAMLEDNPYVFCNCYSCSGEKGAFGSK